MSFGGGSSGGSSGVNSHLHNSQSQEGAPLQLKNSITTGSSLQFNGGSELPLEVLV